MDTVLTTAQVEKRIIAGLARPLSSRGFKPTRPYLLERPSANAVTWQLRCGARADKATKSTLVGLSAGLRFEAVEAFLNREQEPRASTLSVPIHLFHREPVLLEWDAAAPDTVDNLVEEVQKYALPFFERYERLENLCEALESSDPKKWLFVSRNGRVELLIGVMVVLGRRSDAITWAERAIEELGDKPAGHRRGLERLREKLRTVCPS